MDTRTIYVRVLSIVEFFLRNATHLTIHELKDFDPSLEELARDVRALAGMLRAIAAGTYDDENMAINALQCCFELERLAKIVQAGDDSELEQIFKNLEMHVRVP